MSRDLILAIDNGTPCAVPDHARRDGIGGRAGVDRATAQAVCGFSGRDDLTSSRWRLY